MIRGALAVTVGLLLVGGPAAAHHVGSYSVRDNELSQNFKQVKFAIQARKFDTARELFATGAVRREIEAQGARLPGRLETIITDSLAAGDSARAEAALALVFAALARDLAVQAETRLAEAGTAPAARQAAGGRFLEAIWRYWNLIDFVVSQRDPKAAVAVRLAYDEAETLARGGASTRPVGLPAEPASGVDPGRLVPSLAKLRAALTTVVETLTSATRRTS